MADTVRTQITLLEQLFRDGQGKNSISAQDMRDMIVSTYNMGRWTIIAEKDDLPDPVGGVITLAAATDYFFVDNIDFQKPIQKTNKWLSRFSNHCDCNWVTWQSTPTIGNLWI